MHSDPTSPNSRIITLVDHASTYWDGGEDQVTLLLRDATDLRSTSHELSTIGTTWPEIYHLTKERANVVRALELPSDAHVLEIGAGCGAITRYLAEQCAHVDALEPVPGRARAIDARTRDLDNVTIYVGMLEDLPREPKYDIVFVIGVLEYVGNGTAERAPYEAFLEGVTARLKPGGALVLAIENRVGVKYFAGAAEDHTGRVYDSLEGYPEGTQARTFARNELEALIAGAGLEPRTFMAFPDYKLTRAVIAADADVPSPLLANLPRFPSPDWSVLRPRVVDEGRLWSTLVEAGLHAEFPNSFLVVAQPTGTQNPTALWPDDRLATYFSTGRATWHSVRTDITRTSDEVFFTRTPLANDPLPSDTRARVRTGPDRFVIGTALLEALETPEYSDADRKDLLVRWRNALDDLAATHGATAESAWDALPHNAIIEPNGAIRFIDVEWRFDGVTWDDIVRRGALLTGMYLAIETRPSLWPGCARVRDVVVRIGDLLELPDGWIDTTVAQEASFQAEVPGRARTPEALVQAVDDAVARLGSELARPLASVPMAPGRERRDRTAPSSGDALVDAIADMRIDDTAIADREAEIARLREELAQNDARYCNQLAAIHQSWSWRVTKPLRGVRRLLRGR